ncbi:fructosamine kinase family protein [Halosquirtibacter xylanolyticus]|uniref:fructosamine kinase family protein n=1 Tax=Halosquirtibacter xylanolyticus TaxID=3374599 RepID=UPI00374999C7|nr:fructosamine kinase family protein [Prolixibacteraceae bacterium]
MSIPNSVLEQIEVWAEEPIQLISHQHIGHFTETAVIQFRPDMQYFLKYSTDDTVDMGVEVRGLRTLNRLGCVNTPKVSYNGNRFILMDYIAKNRVGYNFFYDFGVQVAKMHEMKGDEFGLSYDNYIGPNLQSNLATKEEARSWTLFFWNKRLLPQYELAKKNGLVDIYFSKSFHKFEEIYPMILLPVENETPSLLHGDLWSGNYLVGNNGDPVLIDSAIYYGHREADLAMTSLFGGFEADFYRGYHETNPLPSDWEERQNVYMLYHMLNHMNIYGEEYKAQAMGLMNYYLS